MTGHQPHPGMGITMMGEKVAPTDIEKVLKGLGVKSVRTVDPLNFIEAARAVGEAIEETGVRAIIFKSPCIAMVGSSRKCEVDADACVSCMYCINEIGCPALITDKQNLSSNGKPKVRIDEGLCTGCGLCMQLCPARCIKEAVNE